MISLGISAGLLSTYLVRGILRNGPKIAADLPPNSPLKQQLDEVIEIIHAKKAEQFKQFVNKWSGKSIKGLTISEISNYLKGFTEQAVSSSSVCL